MAIESPIETYISYDTGIFNVSAVRRRIVSGISCRITIDGGLGYLDSTYRDGSPKVYEIDWYTTNYPGRGLGSFLLKHAREEALALGADVISAEITTRESLESMKKCYGDSHITVHTQGDFSEIPGATYALLRQPLA